MLCITPLLISLLSLFYLAVVKNCTAGNYLCKKEILIRDKENAIALRLLTDLTLTLDDYPFTVDQLQQSSSPKLKTFAVSKVGNTLVFVSHMYNIWVRFDELGDAKIGVAARYSSLVDGLCGYYNGIAGDDKRLPNGDETLSTVDFGDAWMLDKDSKRHCEPHACSQEIQATALQICNKVKDETFARCRTAINIDQFISKCLETACDCIRGESSAIVGYGDSSKDSCSCSILQNFVSDCLATDGTIYLDNWRSVHGCYKQCPAPLIYKDCYRRRCEPSCTLLDANDCPQLPGTCFSGCYCPEGTVRKGELCVPPSECKDCVCSGYGQSQYLTYDRQNFSFDGNCTYLLSRDLPVTNGHTFQAYVTLGACDQKPNDIKGRNTCTKSLHILYGPHIVHLQRNAQKPKWIDILIDGVNTPLPYECAWIVATKRHGNGFNLNYVKSLIEVDVQFDDLSFVIKVPSIKYGGRMEGLCGDCNGNPHNDLKANPKSKFQPKSGKLNDILQTWLADEPMLGEEKNCVSDVVSTADCVPLSPDKDPCMAILRDRVFGQCHLLVDPQTYVSSCQQDMCKTGLNQKSACSYLAAYARECAQNGICVDWKKDGQCKENVECAAGMAYEPCGCRVTCDDLKQQTNVTFDKCPTPLTDGCFCPKGTILHNGKCIKEKECHPCDEQGHFFGDAWHPDKCTQCECDRNGQVQCVKKQCTAETVCSSGYQKVVIDDHKDCCSKSICCPILKPIECGRDQKLVTVEKDGCKDQKCVCDPKIVENCKPPPTVTLRPGERLEVDQSGCCPVNKVICDKSNCPPRPYKCDEPFYEVAISLRSSTDLCCDIYACQPPKDYCIVDIAGVTQLKNIADVWPTENACVHKRCAYGEGGHAVVVKDEQNCQIKSCPNGFKLKAPQDKCCGVCVQTHCIVDGALREPNTEWTSSDLCTSFKCSDTFIISSMHKTCPDVSQCPAHLKYFDDCCDRCKLDVSNKGKHADADVKQILKLIS